MRYTRQEKKQIRILSHSTNILSRRPRKMKLGDYIRQMKRITFMMDILEAL